MRWRARDAGRTTRRRLTALSDADTAFRSQRTVRYRVCDKIVWAPIQRESGALMPTERSIATVQEAIGIEQVGERCSAGASANLALWVVRVQAWYRIAIGPTRDEGRSCGAASRVESSRGDETTSRAARGGGSERINLADESSVAVSGIVALIPRNRQEPR